MNPTHAQLCREHRERRLFAKLEAAREQRQRYLATHNQVTLPIVEAEITSWTVKINQHMKALRQ